MPSMIVVSARDKFVKTLIGRLKKGGYISVVTENPNEVFELLEWMFFHLAIVDFSNPDGEPSMMDVVERLRESDPTLPIVAMPVDPQDPYLPQLKALGVTTLVAPVPLIDVLELAQAILQTDPYARGRDED